MSKKTPTYEEVCSRLREAGVPHNESTVKKVCSGSMKEYCGCGEKLQVNSYGMQLMCGCSVGKAELPKKGY